MARFQIIPISEKTGKLPPEQIEFTSVDKAQEYLSETQDKWSDYDQVLIVNKKNGNVIEFWQEIK